MQSEGLFSHPVLEEYMIANDLYPRIINLLHWCQIASQMGKARAGLDY